MIQYITYDKDGRLTAVNEHGQIVFTSDDTWMVNRYGNVVTINDINTMFQRNSPTYEKLYEHWLKTKGE